jgi:virginiamycin B lyase
MTTTTSPAPRPLCAVFAPLLPLISSSALESDEAAPTREHVAGCDWCQRELARYVAVDDALRQRFGAPSYEDALPFLFDRDDDDEDYSFILEDTMTAGHDQRDPQPSATVRSPRWNTRRRGLTPRATAIASIAAALILAVVATTIYTQFAARRSAQPVTTTPVSAFSKVIKLPNPVARIGRLVVAPDGSIWFTETISHGNKIGRISPDGTLTEFPIPSADGAINSEAFDITLGPDGTLWFVFFNGFAGSKFTTSLIRMTPDGAMTAFPLPPNVFVSLLLFGPDGALWFSKGNKLGRMTSDGQFSEYPVPAPASAPRNGELVDLCVGPDGALWYAWGGVNSIGRMTLSGQAKNFAVPYTGLQIISGPDGALWYTEGGPPDQGQLIGSRRPGVFGHITTEGVVTEVPIETNLAPLVMVLGSDGALWFTLFEPRDQTMRLARTAAGGQVTIYSTTQFPLARNVAAGPGFIWLLDDTSNTVWRFRLLG